MMFLVLLLIYLIILKVSILMELFPNPPLLGLPEPQAQVARLQGDPSISTRSRWSH
jgi:hypothetical protein